MKVSVLSLKEKETQHQCFSYQCFSYQCFSYQCFRIRAFRISVFRIRFYIYNIYIAEVGYLLIKNRQESVFPMKLIVFLECHFATVNISDTCLLSTRILDTYSQ